MDVHLVEAANLDDPADTVIIERLKQLQLNEESQRFKGLGINNANSVYTAPEPQIEQDENDKRNSKPDVEYGLAPVVEKIGELDNNGVLISIESVPEEEDEEARKGANENDPPLWEHVEEFSFQHVVNEEVDATNIEPISEVNNEITANLPVEPIQPSGRSPVDIFIDNVASEYWIFYRNRHDYSENILRPGSYNPHPTGDHWNPRYKGEFSKDKGLLHAIIKHGYAFEFLVLPDNREWLDLLNKECETLKHEKDDDKKEKLKLKIEIRIQDNFSYIIILAKQLGNHLYDSLRAPGYPVFQTLGERAFLVFYKICAANPNDVRYFLFVLADGERNLAATTVVTALRTRPKGFQKKIAKNKVVPNCWINYANGNIRRCTPDHITDHAHYICFDVETIDHPFFLKLFHTTFQWVQNIEVAEEAAKFREHLKKIHAVSTEEPKDDSLAAQELLIKKSEEKCLELYKIILNE